MNLGALRKEVIKETGHVELVVDAANGDFTDNTDGPRGGANKFINQANRWLYRNFVGKEPEAWLYKLLSPGQSRVTFSFARIIKEVWVTDPTSGTRILLDKKSADDIRQLYPQTSLSAIGNDTPRYWTILTPGLAPEQSEETSTTLTNAGITDIDLLSYGNAFSVDAIAVFPPTNVARTLEVFAEWYDQELTADEDVSYWSIVEPDLLKRATKMEIETELHRNSDGRKDYEGPLRSDLEAIYFKKTAEEQAGPLGTGQMNW